jgi:hypothetical protein
LLNISQIISKLFVIQVKVKIMKTDQFFHLRGLLFICLVYKHFEEKNHEKERIQDVEWDLSSNTVPSLLEVLKDNHLELLVSTRDLCA